MTVITAENLGTLDDDQLAALYTTRFQGRLLADLLGEDDERLLVEIDRRAFNASRQHDPHWAEERSDGQLED